MGLDIYKMAIVPASDEDGEVEHIQENGVLHQMALALENSTGQSYLFYESNEYYDFPKYLKHLFSIYCLGKKIKNPFTEEQLIFLFGYDNGKQYPNMPHPMFMTCRSSLDKNYYHFFQFDYLKNQIEIDLLSKLNGYLDLYYEIQNKNKAYDILADFVEYVATYQITLFLNQDNISYYNKERILMEIAFNPNELHRLKIGLAFTWLDNEDLFPNIPVFTKNLLSIKNIQLDYQQNGLSQNNQLFKQYSYEDIEYVTDNKMLKNIAQEFECGMPIRRWHLKENEYVYFSY